MHGASVQREGHTRLCRPSKGSLLAQPVGESGKVRVGVQLIALGAWVARGQSPLAVSHFARPAIDGPFDG